MSPAKPPSPPFPSDNHDHDHCIAEALDRAEAICTGRGARLTALRRRVLELIWASHAPVGAYEVLRRLSQEHARAAPPTVYRALDFLLEQGLIHRIESLNAFVGCHDPTDRHTGQFLICDDCGSAAELQDSRINKAISAGATKAGFAVARSTVEVRGLCPGCRETRSDHG